MTTPTLIASTLPGLVIPPPRHPAELHELDAAAGPEAMRAARAGPAPPGPDRPRCRRCRHPIRVEVSLAFHIGPKCRRKLGIAPPGRRGPASWRSAPSGRIPPANPHMPGQDPIPDLLETP